MCGITGVVDFNRKEIDRNAVRIMTKRIAHRGPDDEGYYFGDNVGLGHRRLSVIDIDGGKQPMRNEDGTLYIIYNGEIYNFKNVRDELIQKGHRFSTKSDTETIIHAYEEWGAECLNRFNGMFAFAIWDEKKKELFMARDRIGVKPFVYYINNNMLYFASEARPIALALGSQEYDSFGLFSYFLLQYIPGENTIYKNIKRLDPGEAALFSNDGFRKWKWWKLPAEPKNDDDAETHLLELLDDSVRIRLISDVPLGAFLSGGLDSSLVVAMMSRHADEKIKTYQVAFEEPRGYDETPYAVAASDTFHTVHNRVVMKPEELSSLLPEIASKMGEPIADPALIPTYIISGLARKEVAVVLTGEGGDELFAGYLRYRLAKYAKYWQAMPSILKKMSCKLSGYFQNADRWMKAIDGLNQTPSAYGHLAMTRVLDPTEIFDLMPDIVNKEMIEKVIYYFEPYFKNINFENNLRASLNCDLNTWLPCDLLTKVDLMSMAHGLEARTPYLDYRIVEWASGLPENALMNRKEGKLILKKAARSVLPESVVNRKKKGFDLPLDSWFRGALRTTLIEAVEEAKRKLPINGRVVDRWVNSELTGKRNYGLRLFSLILLGYWLENTI